MPTCPTQLPIVARPARPRPRSGFAAVTVAALLTALAPAVAPGQRPPEAPAEAPQPWYDRLSLRGYVQLRYNQTIDTDSDAGCASCARTIDGDAGFLLRRARLVISGEVHPRVSIYLQPDFATSTGGQRHFAQIRDLYADVYLDAAKTLRVRLGQSKVPWGWQDVQSSSVRLPLDRDDALNSGIPNERDLGVFAYWTPAEADRRFAILSDSGLKGTGDYGVVGVGVYNGQTANRAEANDAQHVVARVTYPFRLPNGQFVEIGVQGYHGRFVLPQRSTGVAGPDEFDDARVAVSIIVYPQPFGVQAEWNTGRGPEFVPAEGRIATRRLEGGYVQVMYRAAVGGQQLIPYARAQRYEGGKKLELDARRHRVRELELGVEWLPFRALELTAAYIIVDRRTADGAATDAREKGQLLRVHAQVNY